jgi:hypothetical protein
MGISAEPDEEMLNYIVKAQEYIADAQVALMKPRTSIIPLNWFPSAAAYSFQKRAMKAPKNLTFFIPRMGGGEDA